MTFLYISHDTHDILFEAKKKSNFKWRIFIRLLEVRFGPKRLKDGSYSMSSSTKPSSSNNDSLLIINGNTKAFGTSAIAIKVNELNY